MKKADKEAVIEFLWLIRCSVATRYDADTGDEDDIADDQAEIKGYNILARQFGIKPIKEGTNAKHTE